MKSIQFIFGLHNHQPVGNFDSVFEEAFQKAYQPFMALLEKHAHFRATLHHTGPLLEWLKANHPVYLRRLADRAEAGQVEILGGAFYEPILPVIPEEDRIGQIVKMSDWLEKHVGIRPRGMWLAERVWEPTLPRAIRAAGIEFTVLDDAHFRSVGLGESDTFGYYLTEDQGASIAIFPINSKLRYTIPFQAIPKTFEYLHEISTETQARCVLMADDGEKFGVWPETFRTCYSEAWLENFARELRKNAEWVHQRSLAEIIDTTAPLGRVYLPTASYGEMMEWAMPPDAIGRYEALVARLKARGEYEMDQTFIRAGFWRSFFSKYEESNHLHKKMLHVSRKLRAVPPATRKTKEFAHAQDSLWRGQCNCAYWHGVFGGLYLTNLRTAIYKELITAETIVDKILHAGKRPWTEFNATDFDVDGGTELLVETPSQALVFKPHVGGTLVEHDLRSIAFNLLDTLRRRREAYHEKLVPASSAKAPDPRARRPEVKTKEANLDRFLVEDPYRRCSLVDHFLGEDANPWNFRSVEYQELGDFIDLPYSCDWSSRGGLAVVTMTGTGAVLSAAGVLPVSITKVVEVSASSCHLKVRYRVENLSAERLATRFGVEFNVNLLAGHAHDRVHSIAGKRIETGDGMMDSIAATPGVSMFGVHDGWLGLNVEWNLSKPATHWRLPIETVSNSEAGFERVYQSTVLMPVWKLDLGPESAWEVEMEVSASPGK